MKVWHWNFNKGKREWFDLKSEKPIHFNEGGHTREGWDEQHSMYWIQDNIAYRKVTSDAFDCNNRLITETIYIYNPKLENWKKEESFQRDANAERMGY